MKGLPDNFKKEAVKFIDSFCFIHHSLEDLGVSTNFLHTFQNTTVSFQKLDVETFESLLNQLECEHSTDSHELNKHNKEMILSFITDVKFIQSSFLNLTNESDFIAKLIELKRFHRKMNTLNVRSIIYENCL